MNGVVRQIERLRHIDEAVRDEAMDALVEIGQPAVPLLTQALAEGTVRTRCGAAEAVGKIGGARAVVILIAVLHDQDRRVRQKAAQVLGEIALREPLPDLRAALPLLRRLWWAQWPSSENEQVFEDVIRQIEEATAILEDLPLPAEQPVPSAENLPLPAGPPSPVTDELPIPATSAGPGAE